MRKRRSFWTDSPYNFYFFSQQLGKNWISCSNTEISIVRSRHLPFEFSEHFLLRIHPTVVQNFSATPQRPSEKIARPDSENVAPIGMPVQVPDCRHRVTRRQLVLEGDNRIAVDRPLSADISCGHDSNRLFCPIETGLFDVIEADDAAGIGTAANGTPAVHQRNLQNFKHTRPRHWRGSCPEWPPIPCLPECDRRRKLRGQRRLWNAREVDRHIYVNGHGAGSRHRLATALSAR
jgi:hypothetical protein